MKKKLQKPTFKKILMLAIIFILFFNLVKSFRKLTDRLGIIKEAKLELVEEEKRQENLKRELAKTQSLEFIEKAARDKLNMGKEGELIILLPTPVLSPSPTPITIDKAANWQKWARLFM